MCQIDNDLTKQNKATNGPVQFMGYVKEKTNFAKVSFCSIPMTHKISFLLVCLNFMFRIFHLQVTECSVSKMKM